MMSSSRFSDWLSMIMIELEKILTRMCLTDIYECGFIHNPLNKSNSVLLAEEGLGKNYGEEQSWIKDAAIC